VIAHVRRAIVGVPLALACMLVFGSAPAFATREYPLLRTITLPEADGGPFHDLLPNSVAIDDLSGETLVADSGTGLIQVFNAKGEYVETWNGSNVTGIKSFGGGYVSVATDNTTGRVYVFDSTDAVVDVLEATGEYVETWDGPNPPAELFGKPQPISFFGILFPDAVTVNQANGHVLVLDRENNVVDVFEGNGKILKRLKGEPEPIGPGSAVNGEIDYSDGLAVDEVTGDLLVRGSGKVSRFEELSGVELPPLTPIEAPGSPSEFELGGVGTSSVTGNIFVSRANPVYVFASGDEYLGEGEFASSGLGVTVDQATGDIYISHDAENNFLSFRPEHEEQAVVNIFSGVATVPPARVEASEVEKKAGAIHVTLKGSVDPEGLLLTGCKFEYGINESYGQSVACAQGLGEGSGEIGKGFLLVHVSAELPNPKPGTTYDYRLAVENTNGPDRSLNEKVQTPEPLGVNVGPPSNVEKKEGTIIATLNGAVNPEGEEVEECYFEYGTTSVEEHVAQCSPPVAALGSGTEFQHVHVAISGLSGNTPYVYRLVAKNAIGKSEVMEGFETPAAVMGLAPCTASELLNSEATLHGSFEPEGISTSWYFEYRKAGTVESWSKTPGAVAANSQAKALEVEKLIASLAPNTSYNCRLTAENTYGTTVGPEGEFTTASPPVVEGESFSAVGFSSVTLQAKIDGFGARDGYRFEYGTSKEYETSETFSTSEAVIANPVRGEVQVRIPVTDLKPATTYYFRVIVTQPHNGGTAIGEDEAKFTTFPETSALLPDGRVYEMVSPVEAQGANVYVPEAGNGPYPTPTMMPFQASANGEAVAYVGAPSTGGNGNVGADGANEYLARLTSQGWASQDITPLDSSSPAYLAFSSDLSTGILESREPLALEAPGGGYDDLYTRSSKGGYQPLITEKPPNRTPEEFSSFGTLDPANAAGLAYAGASADFSHLLFEANDALAPEAKGEDPGKEANDLYDSVGGQLSLVNVLPGGDEPAPGATFGAPNESGEPADPPDFSHVISSDGARIFWTDLKTGDLYVRENGTSTVPVSAGPARFWTATPDGRYVFYTEGEKLYRFDVENETREELAGAGAEVQGVIGVNETGEDGSYVYFVADGELAEHATPGEPNLYLLHEGRTRFIATLAPAGPNGDEGTAQYAVGAGSFGDWEPGIGHRTAEVTPDGHSIVFQSVRPLTEYDSEGLAEVFVYDSEEGGSLICASCDRSGETPPVKEVEVEGASVKIKAAAYLPVSWSRTYMPRFISEDGDRVFFNTFEPLIAADPNNQQDVYEWERNGEGTCAEASGCDYLLSGGTSPSASYLVDASANGDDVFFVTDARLVPQDDNESDHLYDDRVDGLQPSSPAGCAGLQCVEEPIAPPIFAAPPSATFAGVGNFPPSEPKPTKCKKGYGAKNGKCKKKAKKASKAHKSRKSPRRKA
jgi:hypothetical protein